LLDVEDPIASQYTLEVSSPGIDRPLFTAAQFGRWIGEEAKVTLRIAQDGRRRFQARIVAVEGDEVLLSHPAGNLRVAHANIEKARLVPDLVALGLAPQPRPGKAPAAAKKDPPKKGAPKNRPAKNSTNTPAADAGADTTNDLES